MVTIKIHGDGLSFEAEVSMPRAAQIIAFVGADDVTPAGPIGVESKMHMVLGEPRRSINEMLADSGAKTFPDIITVMGRYLEITHGDGGFFQTDEVKPLFVKGRLSAPKNFKRDFDQAIKLGYIHESNETGSYYITPTGLEAIENKFVGVKKVAKKQSSPKRTKRSILEAVRIDIEETDTVESLASFIEKKRPGNSAQEMIVVMAYYFNIVRSVLFFTAENIEFAYRALGLQSKKPANLRQALFDAKSKKQFIERDNSTPDGWRISAWGQSFVDKKLPAAKHAE